MATRKLDYSATRSATGVRHGDTVGVESDAFCVYLKGKEVGVDLLAYLLSSADRTDADLDGVTYHNTTRPDGSI